MMQANVSRQKTFIEKLEKNFYEFKYVEIISDREVKEHFSFVYPHYEKKAKDKDSMEDSDKWSDEEDDIKSENLEEKEVKKVEPEILKGAQYLFFDSEMDYMLERLAHARVFLYKKVRGKDRSSNRVEWKLAHRFTQFPVDLADLTEYPYIFSPNFKKYIDVDRKAKLFMIRHSETQEVMCQIPSHILNFKTEKLLDVASRFAWLGNNTLKVISSEGIERKISVVEKIVDTGNGQTKRTYVFKEEKFNVIPLFEDLRWA